MSYSLPDREYVKAVMLRLPSLLDIWRSSFLNTCLKRNLRDGRFLQGNDSVLCGLSCLSHRLLVNRHLLHNKGLLRATFSGKDLQILLSGKVHASYVNKT